MSEKVETFKTKKKTYKLDIISCWRPKKTELSARFDPATDGQTESSVP